jgi:AbrB family looped-hinge helix DNA binding protein
MQTTRLSSKGQIVLPKSLRDARRWRPGTEFVLEETPAGILLRPAKPFPPTTFEQVEGRLKYRGRPRSLAEMDKGIRRMIRK